MNFERFWGKVDVSAGPTACWLWTAYTTKRGYGQFSYRGKPIPAHRFAYELLVGPIPAGLQVDHVRARGCVNRHCVNPAHLEPVTCQENLLRGETRAAQNAAKDECPSGHPYSGENLYEPPRGGRQCRECVRTRSREYQRRRRTEGATA